MTSNESHPVVASLRSVTKSFDGTTVVRGVDLDVRAGEVHILAGENGAGKSTLTKLLAGIHQPDSGWVEIGGRRGPFDVRSANEAGVTIVHQELLVAPNLTVADNLAMGREHRKGWGLLDRATTAARAREQLDRVGAEFSVHARADELTVAEHQLIEIARALAQKPRILILDEPTSALSATETQRLLGIVAELRDAGTAIIYITHRMDEIEQIADVVTVMRDGAHIATLGKEEATPETIVLRMVGRKIESLFATGRREPGETVLRVESLGDGREIGPIDLEVRAGEVVGIGGLIGSGRSEFLRLIFGADRAVTGTVTVDGAELKRGSPSAAIRAGVAMLPESRKTQGLVLEQSITSNVVVAELPGMATGGIILPTTMRRVAAKARDRLKIKNASLQQNVVALSGGNQQKVLFAKWLETKPRVLILDEPTRGVDVGAKADIYRIIDECAKEGVAVLVVSSELPELIGLSDRVHVMRDGKLVAELPAEHLSEETIMAHAFGLAPETNHSLTEVAP
ncbi:sugar ABC transporter ATP-binding protein [Leucobacter allii]|uniref:Sugar ABC transporter ATP-binding protein n=1 Tax=Leucobacter allii TaxID=2932247 RepID=A0ABY4FNN6_9MICO|nr:sugar ABC transporter ATP-binding protein [Leucobacter allii]UOQ57861.1 sugar ABC transporter ATP-binding protein [Leucobacter allii]UOR02502.1 sugar ABC transporter ATP-binding protein [Leucobacter allii]